MAELAAAVHLLDHARWSCSVPGHPTRRAQALADLAALEIIPSPLQEEALSWAHRHLPHDTPAALLHGDLLGQNILLSPGEPPALIDWEYAALGDPAYDLAIVTRAAGKPFTMADGFTRLLAAYASAGGVGVAPAHVRLHELCLLAGWYRDALDGQIQHSPEHELEHFSGVLRRTLAADW